MVPTLPKYSVKNGPLDFLKKAFKSKKRIVSATLAINSKEK